MPDNDIIPFPPRQHYFANAVGAVDFVPDAYVYLHWTGQPMSSTELRALYVHTRNLLDRSGIHSILADHRVMPTMTDADRDWVLTTWLPATIEQTGYSHCAVLKALEPAHRLHTDPVMQLLRERLTVQVFERVTNAAAWLGPPPGASD